MAIEVWTLSALIGVLASLYGVYEARKDLRALGDIQNGARLVARQRLAAQVIRATITGTWTALGIVYLANDLHPTLNITVFALVMGNLLTTVIAVSDVVVGKLIREG